MGCSTRSQRIWLDLDAKRSAMRARHRVLLIEKAVLRTSGHAERDAPSYRLAYFALAGCGRVAQTFIPDLTGSPLRHPFHHRFLALRRAVQKIEIDQLILCSA